MTLHRPSFEDFRRWTEQAPCVPVFRQFTGDGLTPVSAFRRIERSSPSFLFESVIGGEKVGRYSFLGTEPFLIFEARGTDVSIRETAHPENALRFASQNPFDDLQNLVERYRAVQLPGLPRFAGGAVGYAAYDAVRYTERLPQAPPDDRGLPDLLFAFYDRMVLFDQIRKTVVVVAHAHVAAGPDARAAYDDASARVDELAARLAQPGPELPLRDIDASGPVRLVPESNFTREAYEAVVRHCQEYIKAGDIFQVVPSQRFRIETTAEPFNIYRVLRVVNPSPFLFYLTFRDFCLVDIFSSILVRV